MCSFATTAYTEKSYTQNTFWKRKMSLSFDFKSLIFIISPAPARLHCMDSTQYASYINYTFLHFLLQ